MVSYVIIAEREREREKERKKEREREREREKLNDLLPWKAVGFTRPLDLRVTDTDKIANPALCSFSPRDHVSVSVANAHEP